MEYFLDVNKRDELFKNVQIGDIFTREPHSDKYYTKLDLNKAVQLNNEPLVKSRTDAWMYQGMEVVYVVTIQYRYRGV